MGYTPLFDSLTTGSLHGRWPDIGLWPVILSLADRFGRVDVTPQFLVSATGLPLVEVVSCLDRFCAPDPDSRTTADDGRRLELLDPSRKWGWRILNHAEYREKARLLTRDGERTASGEDAKRKARRRAEALCPPKSPESPESPLSDGDGDGDGDKGKTQTKTTQTKMALRADFDPGPAVNRGAWDEWLAYHRSIGKSYSAKYLPQLVTRFTDLGGPEAQGAAVQHSIGNRYQGLFALPASGNGTSPVKPAPKRERPPTEAEIAAERARAAAHNASNLPGIPAVVAHLTAHTKEPKP